MSVGTVLGWLTRKRSTGEGRSPAVVLLHTYRVLLPHVTLD